MLNQSRSWRTMVQMVTGLSLAVLTACASPPTRFYTLGTEGESAVASRTASPAFVIDLSPVKVPAAVARSQLVVQVNATQVKVLEDERWASPLGDEIRNALLAAVTRDAGAPDVSTGDIPVYHVAVDVQRFESWPGSLALIDLVWSVRTSNDQETLTCHSVVGQPVSAGYDAIVDGHRQAIERIAAQIVEGIRQLSLTPAVHPVRLAGMSGTSRKAQLSCPSLTSRSDAGTGAPVPGTVR